MELNKQVCRLELSQKLESLGVKQESLFYWTPDMENNGKKIHFGKGSFLSEIYSAFTVAELGNLLPDLYYTVHLTGIDKWYCNLLMNARKANIQYPNMEADTEADARATMLIFLLENKLITI